MDETEQLKEQINQLTEKVDHILVLLQGKDGSLGLLGKVSIMWRFHVWILCTISAAAGSVITVAISKSLS